MGSVPGYPPGYPFTQSQVIDQRLLVRQVKALVRGQRKENTKTEQSVHFKKFRSGHFNLTVKYKKGMTDIPAAISALADALAILTAERKTSR